MADSQDAPHIEYRGEVEKEGFAHADAAAQHALDKGPANIADAAIAEVEGTGATRDMLAAKKAALSEGLSYHDSPPGTDADYSGYSHKTLHGFVTDGVSPDEVNEMGLAWNKSGNSYIDAAEDLHSSMKQIDAEWQGDAAEGAKGFIRNIATWFEDSGRGVALTGDRINATADSAAWAKRKMPPPQDFTAAEAGGMVLEANPGTIGGMGDAVNEQAGVSRQQHAEAVRVMTGFSDSMDAHSAKVPSYPKPPGFDAGAGHDSGGGHDTAKPPQSHGKQHVPPPTVPGPDNGHVPRAKPHGPGPSDTAQPPPSVPGDGGTTGTTAAAATPTSPPVPGGAAAPGIAGSGGTGSSPGGSAGGGAAGGGADIGGAVGNVRNRLGGHSGGAASGEEPAGRHSAARMPRSGGAGSGRSQSPSQRPESGLGRRGSGGSTREPAGTERAAPGARGATERGGRGGMPMGGSRGGKQGEDGEHKNKYPITVPGKETFGPEQKVPPQVIGEFEEEKSPDKTGKQAQQSQEKPDRKRPGGPGIHR